MKIDTSIIKPNSIIELCVIPDVQVHLIMKEISQMYENNYFFDTIGNLKFVVDNVIEIYSIRKLIKELKKMKEYEDFVLFIDSITIIGDKRDGSSTVLSLLNELVIFNKATIILSNHYQYYKDLHKSCFHPRLGKTFGKLMTTRVFFQYKRNKLSYEVVDQQ
ncbi:hypothetical protein NBO_10g0093 [Nosema bombycis CQ1]|uniref:Uncharacterized protein n=1 Tax=Nosema bombycis (strain CQ1 / CVCC 102059) TaxID=578461 RepID=R0MQD9_NOSB1|nr:hypothetical protein NBO_1278g0001 [Nosema bombycis CQ1]EOB15103.1 hypothetical protein NBO_10g0093 [Nosema bombycis CQ1]|eukprot:EOB11334.1 hypothetical protein NBO_1278g0001 [Nosema bombycis CQ1]